MASISYTRTESLGQQTRDTTFPRFFLKEEQDHIATAREGRPIFKSIEMVEVIMPGVAIFNKPAFKVTDEHRQRWPEQYDKFKKGQEVAIDGTPIEQWSILNRAQVLELKALEIHTIEACAELSDTAIQRIPMYGRRLRDLAASYLDDAERMATVTRLTEEKARTDTRMAELEQKVTELTALLGQTHEQLMAVRNAQSAVATAVPAASDPIEMGKSVASAEPPAPSALAKLKVTPRGGRGRASKSAA